MKDKLGDIGVRFGINRFHYTVEPGIYSLGEPSRTSPVLVTANYKLTFNALRKELEGLNLWILVLDTNGINVWCAAGKGTFGTKELIYRIKKTKLSEIVSHKVLILPQLGASGVAAHKILKNTGFRVMYGTVRASDIKEFIDSKFKTTEEMREVRFDFKDRLVLTPLEIIYSLKYFPILFAIMFGMNYFTRSNMDLNTILRYAWMNSLPCLGAIFAGAFLVPVLLPYIPFRSFSIKGLLLGLLWSITCIIYSSEFELPKNIYSYVGNIFLISAIASVIALNFTGCTTYTSPSGVAKETIRTIPIAVVGAFIGLILLVIGFKTGF